MTYIDTEIKEIIKKIFEFCEKHEIQKEFYDIDNDEDYEDEEVSIDYEDTIQISLPETDDSIEISIRDLIKDIVEVENAHFVDGYKYISSKRFLIRVHSLERERIRALDGEIRGAFISQITLNGQLIQLDLTSGFTNFALLVAIEGDYDENYPPILYEDLFIEIVSDEGLDERILEDLMQAYIFELSSSMNIEIFPSQRQYCE